MYAEVVDLLTAKGKFQIEPALAVVEAIDMAIERAQLVTVLILDGRLALVNARIDAKIDAVNARIDAVNARIDAKFDAVNARIDALEIRLDAKLQRWSIRMMIVMVASQAALGPVGASALQMLRGVLSTLGH